MPKQEIETEASLLTDKLKVEHGISSKEEHTISVRDKLATLEYKEDKLLEVLKETCIRSGALWSMIVDQTGLPITYFNVNEPDLYSAVSGIILDALYKLQNIFKDYTIDYLLFEVNTFYKLVFKKVEKFDTYYLLVYFMPVEVSEKEEILISENLISEVLYE